MDKYKRRCDGCEHVRAQELCMEFQDSIENVSYDECAPTGEVLDKILAERNRLETLFYNLLCLYADVTVGQNCSPTQWYDDLFYDLGTTSRELDELGIGSPEILSKI